MAFSRSFSDLILLVDMDQNADVEKMWSDAESNKEVFDDKEHAAPTWNIQERGSVVSPDSKSIWFRAAASGLRRGCGLLPHRVRASERPRGYRSHRGCYLLQP